MTTPMPPAPDPWQHSPRPSAPPPVGPYGWTPPAPAPPRRSALPLVIAAAFTVLVLVGIGGGLAVVLLAGDDKQTAAEKDPAAEVFERCQQYNNSRGASITSGEGYVLATERLDKTTGETSGVLECIQRSTDMPESVISDISAASMLMGRQTAEWGNWTLTYDVQNDSLYFDLRLNLRVKGTATQD